MTYSVSISGASCRFRWFIWNSHSKSEITRSPFTIVLASCLRAKSTTSSEKTSTTTFSQASEGVLEERDALLDREERLLVRRVADDADDDAVEDRRRTPDDVDVAVRDGVVAPWADCRDHREKTVIARGTVPPRRDEVERELRLDTIRGLDDDEARRRRARPGEARRALRLVPLPLLVRRIDEHEVEATASRSLVAERRRDVRVTTTAPREAQLLEIRLDDPAASRSRSTKTQLAAPRDSASRPIAPEPAKRSSAAARRRARRARRRPRARDRRSAG